MITNKVIEAVVYCQHRLREIHNINYGGCGYAVYAVFLYLKKKGILPKEFQIVSLHTDKDNYAYNSNKAFLEGNKATAAPAWHFGFTFDKGKTVYDSNGEVTDKKFTARLLIPHSITEQFIVSVLNKSGWNPRFCRETEIPKIEKKLNINLSCDKSYSQSYLRFSQLLRWLKKSRNVVPKLLKVLNAR